MDFFTRAARHAARGAGFPRAWMSMPLFPLRTLAIAALIVPALAPAGVAHPFLHHPWHRREWHSRDHRRRTFPLAEALPIRRLTPGALNRHVTAANIRQTICVRRYTRRIRPPEQYTERLKRRQIRRYRYSDLWLRDYEEDHLFRSSSAAHRLRGAISGPSRIPSSPAGAPTPRIIWRIGSSGRSATGDCPSPPRNTPSLSIGLAPTNGMSELDPTRADGITPCSNRASSGHRSTTASGPLPNSSITILAMRLSLPHRPGCTDVSIPAEHFPLPRCGSRVVRIGFRSLCFA